MVLFASLLRIGCVQTEDKVTDTVEEGAPVTQETPAPQIEENITIPTADLPEIVDSINESEGDFPDLI